MSAAFKPWLLLGGIFVVGVITGSALTFGIGAHFMHPRPNGDMRTHWIAFLVEQLNLTSDQKAKIMPIVMDGTKRIQDLHHDEVQQGDQIFRTVHEQVMAVLTPDQKVEFKKLEDERERMFMDRMRQWGPPGGRPPREGPPGGGPPGEGPPGRPFDGGPENFDRPGMPPGEMTPPSFHETPTHVAPPPPEQPPPAPDQKL